MNASNSFTSEEVDALIKLFRQLENPATYAWINVKVVRKVQGKFLRMRKAIDDANDSGPKGVPGSG